jgi:hypothetical protein
MSSRATTRSDGDQIVIGDRPDIPCIQRQQRRRPARRRDELDFEPVWLMDFHDGAEIARPQAVRLNVAGKDNRVEHVIHHLPTSG